MRTIAEIKEAMMTDWMRNEDVARLYGFETGTAFYDVFSRVSVESLLMYVAAVAIHVLEVLMAQHRSDVDAEIEAIIPHRPKWYRDKMLDFMKDHALEADSDTYDTTDMSDEEVTAAKVVKYAAATENKDSSILTIKVAGEDGGQRVPLDAETENQLKAYIGEVKDAGVRIALINQTADMLSCEVSVWYDAQLTENTVRNACEAAIKSYIENLPFNGEYTNMALVDALQTVPGVKIVELKGAETQVSGESTVTAIDARYTPAAGYFMAGTITLNMTPYNETL